MKVILCSGLCEFRLLRAVGERGKEMLASHKKVPLEFDSLAIKVRKKNSRLCPILQRII